MPAMIAVIAVILYFRKNLPSDDCIAYRAIVDSLLAGNNWGRQALVGNTDYPVLQTLMLLVSEIICRALELLHLNLDSGKLLVSIAQATMLAYMVKTLLYVGRPQFIPLPLIVAFLLPVTSIPFKWIDPNWLVAVPAAAMTYHVVAWSMSKSIRDMVLASAFNGILCLCGVPCALVSIATSIVFYLVVRSDLSVSGKPYDGMRSLLWTPAVYCLALWFLWNWLVMDNPFFGLRDIYTSLCDKDFLISLLHGFKYAVFASLASQITLNSLAFLAPVFILCMKSSNSCAAKCLLPQLVILIVATSLAKLRFVTQTGIAPLAATAVIASFVICAASDFRQKVSRNCCIAALVFCAFISYRVPYHLAKRHLVGVYGLEWNDDRLQLFAQTPPSHEITEYIDTLWPMSRVMLYGLRLPICYPDAAEKRFVARLDYQEEDLLKQAQDEQLHILVPPPDGLLYPSKGHPLADIYENGRPWLLLEKTWQGGWQLWRVAIPPKDESKLDVFR